jgi:hypothetical protein
MKWNGWSIYWLAWIAVGFLPVELYALFSGHPENTLSDQVWHAEGIGATFVRYFVGAFTFWLAFHMTFRWFH